MRAEEIDALLGGEAQRLADKYTSVPLDFMDGYGWAVTQICRLFPEVVPVIRCKECRFYQGKYCTAWGDGTVAVACETDADGYCYLGKERTDETD